jgi:hypothetical protein
MRPDGASCVVSREEWARLLNVGETRMPQLPRSPLGDWLDKGEARVARPRSARPGQAHSRSEGPVTLKFHGPGLAAPNAPRGAVARFPLGPASRDAREPGFASSGYGVAPFRSGCREAGRSALRHTARGDIDVDGRLRRRHQCGVSPLGGSGIAHSSKRQRSVEWSAARRHTERIERRWWRPQRELRRRFASCHRLRGGTPQQSESVTQREAHTDTQ